MSALELAGAPVVAAYAAWAGSYDDVPNATRDAEAAAVRAWVEAGVVRSAGARVLELGAGTGKNTVLWAAAAESVVACDATGAMLARARTRLADASHITFAEFDMCVSEWPLPRDELFDLAACSLVLEHIGSLEPLFAQVAARLRPGGCFYVGELHPHRQYANKQVCRRAPQECAARVALNKFSQIVRNFFFLCASKYCEVFAHILSV